MKIKEVLAINLQKIVLATVMIFFAPIPFYAVLMGGWAPPILYLLLIPPLTRSVVSGVVMVVFILIILFVIYALIAYLISCAIVWILGKIIKEQFTQWLVLIAMLIIFCVISFFHIYGIADAGGGFQQLSFPELLLIWTRV